MKSTKKLIEIAKGIKYEKRRHLYTLGIPVKHTIGRYPDNEIICAYRRLILSCDPRAINFLESPPYQENPAEKQDGLWGDNGILGNKPVIREKIRETRQELDEWRNSDRISTIRIPGTNKDEEERFRQAEHYELNQRPFEDLETIEVVASQLLNPFMAIATKTITNTIYEDNSEYHDPIFSNSRSETTVLERCYKFGRNFVIERINDINTIRFGFKLDPNYKKGLEEELEYLSIYLKPATFRSRDLLEYSIKHPGTRIIRHHGIGVSYKISEIRKTFNSERPPTQNPRIKELADFILSPFSEETLSGLDKYL